MAVQRAITDRLEAEVELLERHLKLLLEVHQNGPLGILKLAGNLDQAPHRVRYSLRLLEESGLIRPSTSGARTPDGMDERFRSIRHSVRDASRRLAGIQERLDRL